MKESQLIIHYRYINPEHEKYIEKLKSELFGFVEIQGEHHGSKNKPNTIEEYKALVFNKIQVSIQDAIHYNQQIHQPVSGMVVANKIQNNAKNEISGLQSQVADDEIRLHNLEQEKKQLEIPLRKKWFGKVEYIIAGIFGTIEGFFVYDALRGASFSKFIAWITALGVATAVGIGLHVAAGYIRKAQTKLQRNIRYAIVLLIAFIVSYTLGHMRANLYNDHVDLGLNTSDISIHDSTSISVLAITVISFILFFVALGFSIKYWKSDEEKKHDELYELKCKEINVLQDKKDNTEKQIKDIQNKTNEETELALQKYEYAIAVENRCANLAKQAQQIYIDKNLRFRTDGIIPSFFSNPPQFQFKTFFQNVKQ